MHSVCLESISITAIQFKRPMTGQSLKNYARVICLNPRIAIDSFIHRVGVHAIRRLRRRPVVLFERHGGIGDIICTFPAVLALRERHPDAVFVYSVWKSFKSIVEMGRVADYVVEKDWSADMPKVAYQDYDVCYQPWLEDERPLGRKHVHLVDDFAQTLNVTLNSRQPKLYIPTRASEAISQRISPFLKRTKYVFGIQVGPSWHVREWTVEGWTRLVVMLRDNFDCTVIQLGSDADTAKGAIKAPRISGTEDWVGMLTLEEAVAAIGQLHLFIGIDSGLLHAAGAVGTPTVGLFGPINPKLRLPPETPSIVITSDVPCLGCHHRLPRLHWREGCPHNIRCMSELAANEVLFACKKLLNSGQEQS
jgi:ADP-heptose:LPS heptosyltransferase